MLLTRRRCEILPDSDNEFGASRKIPKGDGTVDWQAEYIKILNDDVRHTRTEIENLRNELKADVTTTKQEIKQHIDSKIDSFLTEFRNRDNQRHKV